MTNRDYCISLVNSMVLNGYHLMNRTAEEFVDMMGADVKFFEDSHKNFMNWANK